MKQGWEIKKLGDVVTFKSGYTPKDYELSGVGDVPYYKVSDMNHELNTKYLHHTSLFLKDGCKSFPKHSIVFPKNGAAIATNKKRILTRESVVDLNIGIICVSNLYTLNYEYLYLFIQNIDFRLYIRRGAVPTLDSAELKSLPIPVPPIAEQEKIVAELDCLSGIIEKKKQQLKELDNLAQSIFYEMFGDPVENDKGWDIVTLDDVFEIGSSKRVFESQWTDSGVPFYRAREIVKLSKGENIDSPIFISEELYHEYSRKYGVPAEGDMMVTAVGTLGVCYLVKNTDRFYFKDGNTLWFKSRGLCETRFIKDEFATDFIVNQIKGNANAAVVGTYTITNAKKTRVILPPLSLQQEYVRKVQHIDKQKELLAQSIKETETLFNSRMDYYFN